MVNKTKFMVFRREGHENARLSFNEALIERVSRIKYLGNIITECLNPYTKIKGDIEVPKTTLK